MTTQRKGPPIYAYSAPLRTGRAADLAARGYLVLVAVERADGRPLTGREVRELEGTYPQAHATVPSRRKATAKRVAARTARVMSKR
jgi:hypothetical protein